MRCDASIFPVKFFSIQQSSCSQGSYCETANSDLASVAEEANLSPRKKRIISCLKEQSTIYQNLYFIPLYFHTKGMRRAFLWHVWIFCYVLGAI